MYSLLLLAGILFASACRTGSNGDCPVFSLTLHWHTGSLPPQYAYGWTIEISPGLEGTLRFHPGYDPLTPHSWIAGFSITPDQKQQLYAELLARDMFRTYWEREQDYLTGTLVISLQITCSDRQYQLPAFAELSATCREQVQAATAALHAVVPAELWQRVSQSQDAWESSSLA